MICPPCARAADTHAPRDQHCADPKCMCGHRTDRYRAPAETPHDALPCTCTFSERCTACRASNDAPTGLAAIAAAYDQLDRTTQAHTELVEARIAQVEAQPGDRIVIIPRTTKED
ncbi:hypothetical protein [Streptomyces sp. NRRL F-5123]|uniref:hypothetical protein n=1 Tax=Streptomyces sp. NRRL F-5123 TaxID=1463856 RepID=UPI0004E14AB3|nr:hypothetical protein [Streptomyces sp. NRRL F-5123]